MNEEENIGFFNAEESVIHGKPIPKKKKKDKGKIKAIVLAVSSIALLVVVAFLVFLYNPFTKSLSAEDKEKTALEQRQPITGQYKVNWYEDPEEKYPVDYDDWQKVPWDYKEINREEIFNKYANQGLRTTTLPSELDGAIDDVEKAGEDGYSYWTQENFTVDLGHIIEFIVNPEYGQWYGAQKSGVAPIRNLWAWFTTNEFKEKNGDELPEGVNPFLIDVNHDGFGFKDRLASTAEENTPWFYGEAKDIQLDFQYDNSALNYKGTVSFTAVYTGYDKDKKRIVISRPITLSLVPNPDASPERRVLVNDIQVGELTTVSE